MPWPSADTVILGQRAVLFTWKVPSARRGQDLRQAPSSQAKGTFIYKRSTAADHRRKPEVRMQPCFPVAVKIATVVAARPRGGSDAGSLASTAAWAGLVWAPWPARVPQLRYPGERPACGQRVGGGWCRPVGSCP